jgi:hypothetical protein
MKLSASLTLIVMAFVASSMVQSASAQETRGARFNYAPNIWKSESARVPKGYGEHADVPHNVRSGSVPGTNMLGLDPGLLEKPAPPPQVAVRPATTSVTPRMFVPKTNAAFNPAFGRPQGLVAQSLPAAMPVPAPVVARPQSAPIRPATAPAHVARHRPIARSTGVSGRLMRPRIQNAPITPAAATPAVASYNKNFGYVPGAFLPQNSRNANAEVTGKLMKPGHK